MDAAKHTVFISYRRDGGFETAKYLYDNLVRDGYTVTFDIDTLRNGRFDDALLSRIDECIDFIVILNKGCFDRTLDPTFPVENDWMRRELAYALRKKKNVIPIMIRGFEGFSENLPPDVKSVQWMNGPKYDQEYIDAFYEKLKSRFLKSALQHQSTLAKTSIEMPRGGMAWLFDLRNAIVSAFAHYADFAGRASRKEFWYFALFYFAAVSIIDIVFGVSVGEDGEEESSGISLLFTLATLCPAVALVVRRLHDIGKSGLWAWLMVVPFVQLYLLYLLAQPTAAKNGK